MRSIRFKLWSGMMLLVVFMLVLLWMFQIVFLEKFYLSIHFNRIADKSEALILDIEQLNVLQDLNLNAELTSRLENFAYTQHLNLEVINLQGDTVYQANSGNDQQSPGIFKKATRDISNEVLNGKRAESTVEHPRFNTQYWIVGEPLFTDETSKIVEGVLVLNAPLEPVADTAAILKQQLIYITAILLVVAFAIAFAISRHFSNPLFQISQAAKAITKGDFDRRIKSGRQDEIGQLANDIDEMANELGKTDRLRKELIGNISHELRTPLSLIKGYAETLLDVTGSNQVKREKQLEIIISESDRLSRLIEDVLNFSQLEAGAIKITPQMMAINPMITDLCKKFENLANQKHIELKCNIEETLFVIADVKRVEQVLYNLLGNAINHSHLNGMVTIKIVEQINFIRIEINDNGPGIPEDVLPHIWDRFYTVSESTREKATGTGLGLAIVKSILESHKVQYGVNSTVGRGTSFWFELKKG